MASHDIADRNLIHLTNLRQFYYVYIGLYESSLCKSVIKVVYFYFRQPKKKGDIATSLTVSPWNDVWETRAENPHCHDASLPKSGQYVWLVKANFTSGTTN